jgi:hypothetical protein
MARGQQLPLPRPVTGRRICQIAVVVYQVLCALALLVIPLSAMGAFGIEPDPLAAVFAILLALPWSLFLDQLGGEGNIALNLAFLAVGMVINGALLLALCRLAGRED